MYGHTCKCCLHIVQKALELELHGIDIAVRSVRSVRVVEEIGFCCMHGGLIDRAKCGKQVENHIYGLYFGLSIV